MSGDKAKPKLQMPIYKNISIKTSDGESFQGKINIAGSDRVSDFFARSDNPFIVIVDVLKKHGQIKTLIVNKNFIVWAEPED